MYTVLSPNSLEVFTSPPSTPEGLGSLINTAFAGRASTPTPAGVVDTPSGSEQGDDEDEEFPPFDTLWARASAQREKRLAVKAKSLSPRKSPTSVSNLSHFCRMPTYLWSIVSKKTRKARPIKVTPKKSPKKSKPSTPRVEFQRAKAGFWIEPDWVGRLRSTSSTHTALGLGPQPARVVVIKPHRSVRLSLAQIVTANKAEVGAMRNAKPRRHFRWHQASGLATMPAATSDRICGIHAFATGNRRLKSGERFDPGAHYPTLKSASCSWRVPRRQGLRSALGDSAPSSPELTASPVINFGNTKALFLPSIHIGRPALPGMTDDVTLPAPSLVPGILSPAPEALQPNLASLDATVPTPPLASTSSEPIPSKVNPMCPFGPPNLGRSRSSSPPQSRQLNGRMVRLHPPRSFPGFRKSTGPDPLAPREVWVNFTLEGRLPPGWLADPLKQYRMEEALRKAREEVNFDRSERARKRALR
ncbi:hypothetical protein P7C70_g6872, partial [Phenoliferia sp. Uapishka_3]